MRKSPAFALTALIVLTFGIGGTTTIFTVVRAVLLKPLNYQSPERVMEIGGSTTTRFDEIGRTGANLDLDCSINDALRGIEAPDTLVKILRRIPRIAVDGVQFNHQGLRNILFTQDLRGQWVGLWLWFRLLKRGFNVITIEGHGVLR